jgi:Nif-specific regulatory protein
LAAATADVSAFAADAVRLVAEQLDASSAAIVEGAKGQWREIARVGKARAWPTELMSQAMDEGGLHTDDGWVACLLHVGADGQQLLVVAPRIDGEAIDPASVEAVVQPLAATMALVDRAASQQLQARRLQTVLEMTATWDPRQGAARLLREIAQTATQSLDAERATIFLWDRPAGQLIGAPALGVESGDLRIDDSVGVVGRVVHSGRPERIDEDIVADQSQIDRRVDRQLGFQTRSLVCVPLVDSHGRVIGAFEVINHARGRFREDDQQLLIRLARHAAAAIENSQHIDEITRSRRQVAAAAAEKIQLIGQSEAIGRLRAAIERVAPSDLSVLILGENGTGKEVAAQMIHYGSPRRDHVLVAVNCAALPESLLESELFGHEKGAFTDAHQARAGKFELANGGTLLLDEIGDMSLAGQAKLLRVIEHQVITRVGGSKPITTNVRIIAATNQDLVQRVREKQFREDLFFRLSVVTLQAPPLRERGDDILLLAEHFLSELAPRARRSGMEFTAAAKKRLLAHAWPGNVRELRNLIERLTYLAPHDRIDADDLDFVASPRADHWDVTADQVPFNEATQMFQRQYIERQIRRARNNVTQAARQMGLHRSNLYRKMHQLGMEFDSSSE